MLTRVVDRTGFPWAQLAWAGERLISLRVPGAVIRGELVRHPLLGAAHPIETDDGLLLTHLSAIAWARPTEIPAIAEPGRLTPGSGGAIMNVLAQLAHDAEIKALRYAGPYPTSALWKTLTRSFDVYGTEEAFTAELVRRMATLARDPIAIDFLPSPHERLAIPGGHVELRDGIRRVTLDGITYEPGGSPARLVENRGELWFGDARYAVIAKLAPDGSLRDRFPLPVCEADVIGKAFPAPLALALGELIQELVPAPLASRVAGWLAGHPIVWADCGARAAQLRDTLEVHAAIWQAVAPHGLGRLALALAEALAPVINAALVAELARATTPP